MKFLGRVCIMSLFMMFILILHYFYITNGLDISEMAQPIADDSRRYAVVVDAGSSGSRIYVYCITPTPNHNSKLPLVTLCADSNGKPLTKKIHRGLSTFPKNVSQLDAYISDLIGLAHDHIPKHIHSSTPVYVLASAGMRLLSESDQTKIWLRVKSIIKTKFNFRFEDSWAQTVSGLHEALFGWITVNYLLRKLSVLPTEKSVGMLDMGGASTQIAYELPENSTIPQELYMEFKVGSKNSTRTYKVYVTTFLSYGTQAAKMRYKIGLLHNAMEYSQYSRRLKAHFRPSTGYVKSPKLTESDVEVVFRMDGSEKFVFSDPCLQPGLEDTLTHEDLVHSRILLVQEDSTPLVVFKGTGNSTQCKALQLRLLKKTKSCKMNPCSMNGVHQPVVDFNNTQFYAMSEYWYTSSDLLGKVNAYNSVEYNAFTEKTCKTPWMTSFETYTLQNMKPLGINNKRNVCFKASWIMNVLHNGFGFPLDYKELYPVGDIAGIEVQWSLGALIYYIQPTQDSNNDAAYSFRFTGRQTTAYVLLVVIIFIVLITAIVLLCKRWKKMKSRWLAHLRSVFIRPSATSVPPIGVGAGDGNRYSYSKITSPPPDYHRSFESGLPSAGTGAPVHMLPL